MIGGDGVDDICEVAGLGELGRGVGEGAERPGNDWFMNKCSDKIAICHIADENECIDGEFFLRHPDWRNSVPHT